MDTPLFTLAILVNKAPHLLPLTLDSLKHQNESFEVLIFGSNSLKELLKRYPELQIRVEHAGTQLGEMMNRAVALARGKYIQFLEPGDRYISQYGLSFLSQLTVKEPSLISAQGISSDSHSHWLLKKKVVELGGFDEELRVRPMFDLLCRFEKIKGETLFCRRVIIDSPGKIPNSFRETCKIFYRYYGFWHALKWIFIQDRSQMLKRTSAFLKDAFWKDD